MPISAFARALRTFQTGHLSEDELSWELDRQLAIEKASPVALLELLKLQQVAEPLPRHAHDALLQHIEEWPRDPTIVTGLTRAQRVRSPSAGVGDILQGRFSLVALVGEGGMSRVFKAIDLRRVEAGAANPYVAVKVLTEPYNEYFGSIVALQREAHKLQSLTHPSIVRVIDCDRDGQTVFMTMEFLAGESLQRKFRAPGAAALQPSAALALVSAVGDALAHAHDNQIVHGDLKPGNIIVTETGAIKVIDFGMARFIARADELAAPEAPGQKTPKAVTPRYASPEMIAGRDPEPADDVYALACIAYEAMSGKHPFGRQSDPQSRDPRLQPLRVLGMTKTQYAALVRGLAYDRQRRTATIRQFLDEFLATRRSRVLKRWPWFAVVLALGAAVYFISVGRHPAATVSDVAIATPGLATPGTVIHDCPACPSMTVLPAGRFEQGNDGTAADVSSFEKPRHAVVIPRPFAMSTNEVTVGEYREFAAVSGRDMSGCYVYDGRWQFQNHAGWQTPGFEQNATHPATCVSWNDAVAYANWMSEKGHHTYRLPSSSEWEYAARAGGALARPWGEDAAAACTEANVADQTAGRRYPGWSLFPCADQFVNTAPVGSFKANAFGLNDMLGNVFEWVQDCWYDDYNGAPDDGTARLDGACKEHELRGGSWFTPPRYVSASYRNRFEAGYRSSTTGFRLVREMTR